MTTVDRPGGRLGVPGWHSWTDRRLEKSHPIQDQGNRSPLRGRGSLYAGDPHMVTEPI